MQRKGYFILLTLLIISYTLKAQQVGVLGKLMEEHSDQAVPYANILWESLEKPSVKGTCVSDDKGEFRINTSVGDRIQITISCISYKRYSEELVVKAENEFRLKEDILNLEQITITGTRTRHILKDAPVLTQLISNKEIERVDVSVISDVLELEVPGIETSRHGFGQSMSIQGLGPQYTLILVDGERMAGEVGGNIDYSRINAANIERVEIVRGASSALYGSNAMGGVINIITKQPKDQFHITINTRYQQDNQQNYDKDKFYDKEYLRTFDKNKDRLNLNGNLNIDYRNKHFYTSTYLNYKSLDGYILKDQEAQKNHYEDTVVLSDLGQVSISGFEDYTISNKTGYSKNNWDIELRANLYQHRDFSMTFGKGLHEMYRSNTLGVKSNYRFFDDTKIQVSHNMDTYKKYDVFSRKGDSTSVNYIDIFQNTKVNITKPIGSRQVLFAGIENLYETLETDMFVSDASSLVLKKANDLVLFAQDELKVSDDFDMVMGVRGGYHSSFALHASPSVTLKYKLKPLNLRVNYARGYRSPTLKELYMNWSHLGMFQIIGSKDLKAETNDYAALSIDFINETSDFNATVIGSYNRIYNKIDNIFTSDSTVNYLNLDLVQVLNIEALIKWRINKYFYYKGAYVYTDQNKADKVVSLSEVSPHAFTNQLEFVINRGRFQFSTNINGKIFSKKVIEQENTAFLSPLYGQVYKVNYPAYSLWNLTTNLSYNERITVSAGLKNMFNYRSPTVTMNTSPTIGRRYFVSIRYKM